LLLVKFNGLILLYCLTYTSISRVSGAYDHKMQKGKVLDFWKSYARDVSPPLFYCLFIQHLCALCLISIINILK